MSFPCTGCGLCCMTAGKAVDKAKALVIGGETNELVLEMAVFPYKYDEGGRCQMLNDDHTCSVYENRPDVCNVETMWRKYHSEHISKQNYFLSAAMLCNSMMENAGVDENFYL
jgi:Fe-S-cluster containining protein